MENKYEVACYHWSNWHRSPDNDKKRGTGWTEWQYLKDAIPRFVGHKQPKIPLWGYLDDSLPETLEMQVDAAADHGITAFIFDWGYHKADANGSHGNNVALEDAFLKAENKDRLKFGLMMCGGYVPEDMEALYDYAIEKYFKEPNYWRVDGGLYFSIYEIFKFVQAYGSIAKAADSLNLFRKKIKAAGLGELHLVAVEWGVQDAHSDIIGDPAEAVKLLGIDGITSYVWAHNTTPEGLHGDFEQWAKAAIPFWEQFKERFSVPYYPHVSMGWDPSPRCPATLPYKIGGPLMYHTLEGKYEIFHTPYLSSIITNNTPEQFGKALLQARKYLDKTPSIKTKVVTLYAWNEWTEGGYLEPEAQYGYGYLEAIKEVFGE